MNNGKKYGTGTTFVSGTGKRTASPEPGVRHVTVRLKYGPRGFSFLADGSVNAKRLCYYTRKAAAVRGINRFMVGKAFKVVDETGVSFRNNPKP